MNFVHSISHYNWNFIYFLNLFFFFPVFFFIVNLVIFQADCNLDDNVHYVLVPDSVGCIAVLDFSKKSYMHMCM